ncbi:G8 domain-containing protein [Roseovarius litoreus]|uniref:G8 domain-containing protein n=1 Tax=Roseovarius litoreus TaxID=1155722 RepID=A0A1M7K8F6_9RHOB|nr:G8 domain-containing protein [Roseovarius litoreus]SHM61550.1 G8 domain-containing protein [Roseovarius litoreus]
MRPRLLFEVLLVLIVLFALPSNGHAMTQKILEKGMNAGTQFTLGEFFPSVAKTGQAPVILPQSSQTDTTNAFYADSSYFRLLEIAEMSIFQRMASSRLTTSNGNSWDASVTETHQEVGPFQDITPVAWTMPVFSMSWFSWPVMAPAAVPVVNVSVSPAAYSWSDPWTRVDTSATDPYMSGSALYGTSSSGSWSGASTSSWDTSTRGGVETGAGQGIFASLYQPFYAFDFWNGIFGNTARPAAPKETPVSQPSSPPAAEEETPSPEAPAQDDTQTDVDPSPDMPAMGDDTGDHMSGGDTTDHGSHDMSDDHTDHSGHDMGDGTTDQPSTDMGGDMTDHSGHDHTDHSGHDMGDGTTDQPSTDMGGDMTDHSGHDMGDDHTDHSGHDMGDGTTDQPSTDMGGDMTDHSGHDMGGHHDHGDMSQTGGGLPHDATQAEIDAFVQMVITAPDMDHSMHMDDMGKMMEHSELLDLVPRAEATHIAIRNGDWFDPATWHNGLIPGEDAKVLIPKDISIRYNGESDASLFTLRVDGDLSFATDMNTKMLIDTFVVDSSGRLEIGTKDNPVQSGFDTKIIFANNGDIDVGWDPTLLSRGLISHGQVEIHGEEKTEFLKVADAPMAGDTQIVLSEIPENWSVGDTIVITGTHKEGWRWDGAKMAHFESQDEEVTITAIDGNTITIGEPLQFDHDTPRADLAAYVANMTRNITFTSEDGEASALHHRGHVMFMHNDDVDVRYAAFDDLGRTDKSRPAGDLAFFDTIEADTNIKSRYSFHFHKTGTEIDNEPAYAIGNTVSGSPGWGFVHHSSHADFVSNVAFDVFGAAFAAEDGDETGIWRENLAIRSVGAYPGGDAAVKVGEDVKRDDNGRTGDGFFFAGRLIESMDNVAANTTHGFVWLTRGQRTENLTDTLEHSEMALGQESVRPSQSPIQEFSGNEAFGTEHGLIVVKSSPNQGHDFRTMIEDFVNWETKSGVSLTYTSHYTLKDVDILATQTDEWYGRPKTGLVLGTNTIDLVISNSSINGFETGLKLSNHFTMPVEDSDVGHVFIDLDLTNNAVDMSGFNPVQHTIISSEQLISGALGFALDQSEPMEVHNVLYLSGIKTDSIGATERGGGVDEHRLYLRDFIEQEGFWETTDGRTVIIVPDAVTDRVTGEIAKIQHVIEISNERSWLEANYVNNGTLPLENSTPTANDDFASSSSNTSILIDVLANDRDLDGDILTIDSTENPANGRATILDNGLLEYTPDHDFVGTDSFTYWATDEYGFRSAATITVDIWDM